MTQKSLALTLADLEENQVHASVKQRLEAGDDTLAILKELREGMRIVGERYEKGDYFVSDLIMSAEVFKTAMNILQPSLKGDSETAGKVICGTVKNDIHDIGKDIVVALYRAEGFEVFDLGVDVPPETFITKLKETGAKVLALSGLITMSYDSMKATIDMLTQMGMRSQVKVIIGGGVINEGVREYTGADAWGKDASEAVSLCRKMMEAN